MVSLIDMHFTYLKQPPNRYTFLQPELKKWVESWCVGRTLNLFGGKVRLAVDEISNDIDPLMPTDFHVEAYEFVTTWKGEPFDTVVLDPPYNIRKAREKYEGRYIGSFTKIKDALPNILSPDARVISIGYDSVGMSESREFEKIAICLVCHSGDHNDSICVAEQRINNGRLKEFKKEELGGLFD